MLSLLYSTSSESVFTSTLSAAPVLFLDDWPVRSSFVSLLNKHFLRADFDSVLDILPGEHRREQTRFDSVWLNGLAPRSGVCKSRNPTRNTRNPPGTPGTPPGTPGTPPGTPGTPPGTRWNTSYEATHVFLYKFTCFALNSG